MGGTPKILVFFVGLMNPRAKQVGVLRSLFALRGALLDPVARFPAHAQASPVGMNEAHQSASPFIPDEKAYSSSVSSGSNHQNISREL